MGEGNVSSFDISIAAPGCSVLFERLGGANESPEERWDFQSGGDSTSSCTDNSLGSRMNERVGTPGR